MKKIILTALTGIIALGAMAQDDALAALECKAYADGVARNLKNADNPKKSLKSATWVSLGNAYLDLAQRCPDDSLAAEKAESAFRKALEVEKAAKKPKTDPIEKLLSSETLSSAYLMQGAGFYNNKNYKKAAEYFGRSSEITPKDTTAALYAGIAEQLLENNDGALKYLTKYLNAGGSDPSIYYTIAQIYRADKKFDESAAILKKGIEANPENLDLPNELINVYLVSDQIDKAIVDLEEMVDRDPNNIVNLTNLGLIYDSQAQEFGSQISKINQQLEESNTDRLDRRLISEQDRLAAYESELASLNTKLKREPRTAAATRTRIAEVSAQKDEIENNIKSIISEIEEKKAMASQNNELKAQVANLSKQQNTAKEKAIVNYNKILSLDENNFEALYNMAVLNFNDAVEIKKVVDYMDIATYRTEGKAIEDKACAKFAEAKPYFERANKVKPSDEMVSETLGTLIKILEQCDK